MAEHTPGPLHVTWGSKTETSFGLEIHDASGNLIAQLWWDEGEDYRSVEATWANAALFAAAGGLLATCEALAQIKHIADFRGAVLSQQGQAMDGYSELANYRSIIEKMGAAAIKKAKEVGSE